MITMQSVFDSVMRETVLCRCTRCTDASAIQRKRGDRLISRIVRRQTGRRMGSISSSTANMCSDEGAEQRERERRVAREFIAGGRSPVVFFLAGLGVCEG